MENSKADRYGDGNTKRHRMGQTPEQAYGVIV